MRLSLLGILLVPLFSSAATFGPEKAVAPAEHALAYGEQQVASLACHGQSCLVLWSEADYRRLGLYTSVIDADGTVHPASSSLVQGGTQRSSALVWAGDHYLAVWDDGKARTIVAAPLSAEGLLTGDVQSVTSFPQNVAPDSLAWNGHHALAVFNGPGGLQAALLDGDGHLIRSIALQPSQADVYAVAAAGQTFAVVWPNKTDVFLQRFDDNGGPIDASPIVLATGVTVRNPRIGLASNGSQFGVAYLASDTLAMIQRLRVDAVSGAVSSFPLTSFNSQLAGVFWSGEDFVAYAPDGNNIDTEQFTFDAVRVLNVSPNVLEGPQVVQGPNGAVAIWIDTRPNGYDQHVLGAVLDRNATTIVQRDLIVPRSAVPQIRPALARSPSGALVVWELDRGDERADIVATRLDPAGNALDTTPIPIGTGATFSTYAVTWLGSSYLVVYPYGGSIVGRRISASGAVLDTDPLVFGKGTYGAVASNGTATVVAISTFGSSVKVARLNADGTVMDTQTIVTNPRISRRLSAATNGAEFVVAWTEQTPFFDLSQDHIYAVRLSASGLPMDASPIVVANRGVNETDPAVASDGRDFMIAYTDDANVRVKRLLREGTIVDGAAVIAGNNMTEPRIAFQASHYVLTWTDQYNLDPNTAASEARTATVDKAGAIVDPPSVLAQNDSLFPLDTDIAPGLVVDSRANSADEGIPKLYAREIVLPQVRGRAVRHSVH